MLSQCIEDGEALLWAHHPVEAVAPLARFLSYAQKNPGDREHRLFEGLVVYARALVASGNPRDARAVAERALEIVDRHDLSAVDRATAQCPLAMALWDLPGGDRQRALRLARAADAVSNEDPHDDTLAECRAWRRAHAR